MNDYIQAQFINLKRHFEQDFFKEVKNSILINKLAPQLQMLRVVGDTNGIPEFHLYKDKDIFEVQDAARIMQYYDLYCKDYDQYSSLCLAFKMAEQLQDSANITVISQCHKNKHEELDIVFFVCKVNKAQSDKYTSINLERRHKLPTSLLFTYIELFLQEAIMSIKSSNTFPLIRTTKEIMVLAGRNMLQWAFEQSDRSTQSSADVERFYDSCTTISNLKYEGAESVGSVVISQGKFYFGGDNLHFKNYFGINNHRKVRKLLEITDKETMLVTNSDEIFGVAKLSNDELSQMFSIEFMGSGKWCLKYGNTVLMDIEFGVPGLVKKDNTNRLKTKYIDLFGWHEENFNEINKLVNVLNSQKNGSMLVIMDDPGEESTRLKSQAFEIIEQKISSEQIKLISAIDGAILMNPQGVCYAIGVILDGTASTNGDSSRGSRYNSAIRYKEYMVNQKRKNVLIIIVSEDGMCNIEAGKANLIEVA